MYIKKIFYQSGIYGIGVFFTSLAGFMLLPIYTRYLSVGEFGELSLILAAIFFLQYILNMGIYGGFMMRYFDLDAAKSQKRLISTVMIFYISFLSCVSILIILFRSSLSVLLIGRVDILVLLSVLIITVSETLFTLPTLMFRIKESAIKFTIINISKSAGVVVSVFIALKIFNGGIAGALFAQMAVGVVFTALAYMLIVKQYIFCFDAKELWISFKLGLPILIIMVAFWFIDYANRFIVKYFLTLESLAIYSFGFKVGQLILFLVTTFQTLWQPLMFKIFKAKDAKRIFSDIFTYLVMALFFGALAISIFSNELISIFSTKKYIQATSIVPMAVMTYTLFGIYYFLQTPLILKKRLYLIASLSCFAAVLNIILSFLLVPLLRIEGAIIATFITYFLLVIVMFVIAQRNYKIPYDYAGLGKILLSASIIFLLANSIALRGIFNIIVFKITLLFLFFILLWVLRFFNKGEIAYIKDRIISLQEFIQK